MREDLTFNPQGSVLAGESLENPGRLRAKLCLYLLLIGFAIVGVKLVVLQVLHHDDWVAHVNHQRETSITIYPKRGTIYDRRNIPLATSVVREILCVIPQQVTDAAKLARTLAPYAGMPAEKILRKINLPGRRLVYLKRGLDFKTAEKIAALNLDGVTFQSEHTRHYPKGVLASNLTGFANLENKGLEGLEYKYNTHLSGNTGKRLIIKSNSGWQIVGLEQTVEEACDGSHIILTIDEVIQYITEKALDNVIQSFSPESAAAVVLNPRTGEVLAMACRPTFDPNKPATYKAERLRNRVIADAFEPGSAFKPIAAAAALERKVVTPEDRVYCELGSMRYHGHTYNDVHPLAEISFTDVIVESSNIGMIKIVSLLQPEWLYDCIRGFGFGSLTGINLPGESVGLIRPPSRWSGLSMGSLPIGQEISVTLLQLATAFSAIANDGTLMQPYVVSEIRSPNGTPISRFEPRAVRQAIKPGTARSLAKMMERVVIAGTGTKAFLRGYRCAGKTGTAQKADLKNGGYLSGQYVSVFAGFVPVDNPAACIVVMADSPQKKYYGGQVAAPAFREIAQEILNKLEIPPTMPEEQTPPQTARTIAAKACVSPQPAVIQPPVSEDSDGSFLMPDVRGMTMRAILNLLSECPINTEFQGSGIAYRQQPAAGEKIVNGQLCRIAFKRDGPI